MPLIGAGMEGDAPADPALEHIVENLDLGHGHNGGGPDPEAAPRKGWQGPDGTYQRCCPLEVPALSTFSQFTAFCFSWATS